MQGYNIIEKAADNFRNSNGLGAKDAIRLKSLLRKLNVLTVYRPISDDFSGMALKIERGDSIERFILVNSNHSLGKQHFTIAHELYHLYIQNDFKSMICKTGRFEKKDKEEYNADTFAAIFLMPKTGIMDLIPDIELESRELSLATILKIEHYYSCSRTALLYRLRGLKLIKNEEFNKFKVDIKRGAVAHAYDKSLYEKGNENLVIGDYGDLARTLYDNEKISESYYYTLLRDIGISEKDLENLMNGEKED